MRFAATVRMTLPRYEDEGMIWNVLMSETCHMKLAAASCTFRGSYAHISEAYAAVAARIDANGYVSDGPMFNIYHVSPHETGRPDDVVTEVCYPIRVRWKKASA